MSYAEVIQYTRFYNHSLITTTDATPTEIANIEVEDTFAGMLIVDVISIKTDGTEVNAGRYGAKYSKVGTLTVSGVQTIYESNDSVISIGVGADGDENISIEATGVAATEINWICRTQILDQNFTALP